MVLAKPNILSRATGKLIEPGECFEVVSRYHEVKDGRTYLQLRESGAGWVSTRSRQDFWKIVLDTFGSTAVEPGSLPRTNDSKAAKLLVAYNLEGSEAGSASTPAATSVVPAAAPATASSDDPSPMASGPPYSRPAYFQIFGFLWNFNIVLHK